MEENGAVRNYRDILDVQYPSGSAGRTLLDDRFDSGVSLKPKGHSQLAGRVLEISSQSDLKLKPGEVVLTFDDGPSPSYTPRILKALSDHGVYATFFMVGEMADAHPETAQLVAEAGHTIGSHTHDHTQLTKVTEAAAVTQVGAGLNSVQRAIADTGARVAPFFRFPYLADTPALRHILMNAGMVIFDVDVDSKDYIKRTPDQVRENTLRRLDAAGGGIILFHDIHSRTANMLPGFLDALDERGYTVVRVVPKRPGFFAKPAYASR